MPLVTEAQRAELKEILGEEAGTRIADQAEKYGKALTDAGIRSKSATEPDPGQVLTDSLVDTFKSIATESRGWTMPGASTKKPPKDDSASDGKPEPDEDDKKKPPKKEMSSEVEEAIQKALNPFEQKFEQFQKDFLSLMGTTPRATKARQTAIDKDDPELKHLEEKNGGIQGKSIVDQVLKGGQVVAPKALMDEDES